MTVFPLRLALAALIATPWLVPPAHAAGDDDDDDAPVAAGTEVPTLNAEQRAAVGVVVERAAMASPPASTPAFGLVLDPATLAEDTGAVDAARAAERAAASEVARLKGLYKAGAGASLKNLEAAEAERARAHAEADTASARLAARYAPLEALPAAERSETIDAAIAGKRLLVRVDVPGRRSIGELPTRALLDVDGTHVEGRVLGVLRSADSGTQSASLLVEVDHAPSGFGPGARVPVSLLGAATKGYLVPRGALIYEEDGTFVYRELDAKPGDDTRQYARKAVKPLMPVGDGWLVDGLDDDDRVVVQGAGVLWSLEGIGEMPVDDDD